MTDAHTSSVTPAINPISVTLPDGSKVKSTHQCMLDLPDLPMAARNGHIIPGLASNSRLSVVVFCDAKFKVSFNKYGVIVKYNGKTVLRGSKCARTGLWLVPLQQRTNQEATDGIAEPFANLFPISTWTI